MSTYISTHNQSASQKIITVWNIDDETHSQRSEVLEHYPHQRTPVSEPWSHGLNHVIVVFASKVWGDS